MYNGSNNGSHRIMYTWEKKPFNDKKILSGVGNYGNNKRYYWINSNFSSNYSSRIRNAFSYWINTSSDPGVTTSISFTIVFSF